MYKTRNYNYSYDDDHHHLNAKEAMKRYAEVKERFANAIIELEPLGCGHFDVEAHKTDEAKKAFTRKKMNAYIEKFLKNFVR